MQYGIIVLVTVITVALGTALAVVLVKSNSSKSASNTISSSSSSIEVTTNIQASFTPLQMYDDTAVTSKEQSDLWNIKSAAFRLIASQSSRIYQYESKWYLGGFSKDVVNHDDGRPYR